MKSARAPENRDMRFFDALTWIGRWPFAFCDEHDPKSLSTHLARHRIARALVSPLDAVFAPEPGPANRELLEATLTTRQLEPVPVINPKLGNWREALKLAAADARVRAVRILPAYHDYRLRDKAVDQFVVETQRLGLRVLVQIRLIDERHEYHAMTIKPVSGADVDALSRRHPEVSFLASGLLRSEILPILPSNPRLLADLSFAEWHDTLPHLQQKVSDRQLVFASHTPLLITAAAPAKLELAGVPTKSTRAIATENLEQFLGRRRKPSR
jgi:hypothetical protein